MRKELLGKIHAGYKIIQQGDIAVIGELQTPYGTKYVCWSYKTHPNNEPVDYYWGRYGSKEYVEDCFYKKEHGIYSGD